MMGMTSSSPRPPLPCITRSKHVKLSEDERKDAFRRVVDRLSPLGRKLDPPRPGDWLHEHKEEGQTFDQYLESVQVQATSERNTIVVLPLGDFDQGQRQILDRTVEFLSIFYGLPVQIEDPVPLSCVPSSARRVYPSLGDHQILATWVLHDLLGPRLPQNAATYLCLTTSDLWPGRGWNFVFGQASLRKRVGVWSTHRLEPRRKKLGRGKDAGEVERNDFRLFLRRVLQTASHETGHMFGMHHCTAHDCGMGGRNSLPESDRSPLPFCPECTPKIAAATGVDLRKRAEKLCEFCTGVGLEEEAQYYAKSSRLLAQLENATAVDGLDRLAIHSQSHSCPSQMDIDD